MKDVRSLRSNSIWDGESFCPLAFFWDGGDAYLNGRSLGPVAHAFGAGARLDVAWFGLIERTTLRFDAAKTVNDKSPWQFWFGIQHPF